MCPKKYNCLVVWKSEATEIRIDSFKHWKQTNTEMPPRIRKLRTDAEKEARRVKPTIIKKKSTKKVPGWSKSWPSLPRMKAVIISSLSHAVDSKPVDMGEITKLMGEYVAGTEEHIRRICSVKNRRGNFHPGLAIPQLMSVAETDMDVAKMSRGQVTALTGLQSQNLSELSALSSSSPWLASPCKLSLQVEHLIPLSPHTNPEAVEYLGLHGINLQDAFTVEGRERLQVTQ